MENSNLNSRFTIRKQEVNIREVLDFIWRLKYWILVSLLITVGAAVIYLRMLTPIYERTTWIMMNRDDAKNTEMYLLTDYQGKNTSKKNENELFSELYILKSPTVMSKVVSELGINTHYYKIVKPFGNSIELARNILNIKKVELYNDSPFELTVEQNPLYPTDMRPGSLYLEFKNIAGQQFQIRKFTVNGKKNNEGLDILSYGDTITMGAFSLVLHLSDNAADMIDGGKYIYLEFSHQHRKSNCPQYECLSSRQRKESK